MKYTLLLMLLPLFCFSQVDTSMVEGKQYVILTPLAARNIEYWGNKGISSVPLVSALETENRILQSENKLYELVADNLMAAQIEYRDMVSSSARISEQLRSDLIKANEKTEFYRQQSRKRGGVLVGVGSVILAVIYVTITAK